MRSPYRRLILLARLLCLSWALTSLFVGMSLVYAMLYECFLGGEYDEQPKIFALGASGIGIFVSTALSISFLVFRKKHERLGSWEVSPKSPERTR